MQEIGKGSKMAVIVPMGNNHYVDVGQSHRLQTKRNNRYEGPAEEGDARPDLDPVAQSVAGALGVKKDRVAEKSYRLNVVTGRVEEVAASDDRGSTLDAKG